MSINFSCYDNFLSHEHPEKPVIEMIFFIIIMIEKMKN